jgi:hypothetical protein
VVSARSRYVDHGRQQTAGGRGQKTGLAWGPLGYCRLGAKCSPRSRGVGVSKPRCLANSWSLHNWCRGVRLIRRGDRATASEPAALGAVSLVTGCRLDDLDDAMFSFGRQRRPGVDDGRQVGVNRGAVYVHASHYVCIFHVASANAGANRLWRRRKFFDNLIYDWWPSHS